MATAASERLGPDFVGLADRSLALLNDFNVSVGEDHFMAAALIMRMQKCATLSCLSILRSHFAQSELNNRQAIEFCVLAAYMLANPQVDVTTAVDGSPEKFRAPKDLSKIAIKWLNRSFPDESAALKEQKEMINSTASHASVYSTFHSFDWNKRETEVYQGFFFDRLDVPNTKLLLVSFSQLTLLFVKTLRLTAEKFGGLTIRDTARQDEARIGREAALLMPSLRRELDF